VRAVRLVVMLCLALLVAALGPASTVAQGALPPQGQIAELAEMLDREGTYVAPRARQQVPIAAEEQLQTLITRADQRGVTLRIAVLEQAPSGYPDLGAFADTLMAQMRLQDGLLVVATPQTLAARSDRLSPDQVAPFVAEGQAALQGQGIVAGVAATTGPAVDSLAALVTPLPRPAPDEIQVNVPTRVAAPASEADPLWPALVGMGVLLAGLVVYWWTTQRRWNEVLSALEGARAAAGRLASTGQMPPATVETARRRLEMGDQALEALRALPWWHVWVWPWVPPPQLALAERAFSESLRLLGGGVGALAPAGATSSGGGAPPAGAVLDAAPTAAPAGETLAAAVAPGEPASAAPYGPSGAAASAVSDDATTLRGDSLPPSPASRAPAAPASSAAPLSADAPPEASLPTGAPAAPAGPGRRHFWQRGRPSADEPAEPAASLSPDRVLAGLTPQEPVACFFCGLPLRPEQVEAASVALGGLPLQPLTCHRHGRLLAAGERPGVRARLIGGSTVPWFQDPTFQPAWDFDPSDDAPSVPWDQLLPPDRLFEPQPRVVVHAGDPRWTTLPEQGGSAP
jgi:hypothetical protein